MDYEEAIEKVKALIPIYENAADWFDRTHPALSPAEHHQTAEALRLVIFLAEEDR